jgi:hypothetical protein
MESLEEKATVTSFDQSEQRQSLEVKIKKEESANDIADRIPEAENFEYEAMKKEQIDGMNDKDIAIDRTVETPDIDSANEAEKDEGQKESANET